MPQLYHITGAAQEVRRQVRIGISPSIVLHSKFGQAPPVEAMQRRLDWSRINPAFAVFFRFGEQLLRAGHRRGKRAVTHLPLLCLHSRSMHASAVSHLQEGGWSGIIKIASSAHPCRGQ